MQQVLVLNASYEPLNVCSVRRAHVLVWKGKAEILESLPKGLRSATDTYVWPHVIRLVKYVRVPRAIQRKISRRALFARDGWRCVYCGTSSGRLTLDHVVPRSKGGESIWENVVTACAPCNLRKGDRLLRGLRSPSAPPAAPAGAGALHPPRDAHDPAGLAAVPARRRLVGFTCDVCGATHAGETRDIRLGLPQPIFLLDDDERAERAWVGEDSAVLQGGAGERFFVRALLELPIAGEDGYFGYGAWIEVSEPDFAALVELWHDEDGWRAGPVAGTLANELSPYAFTEGLRLQIQLREVDLLPLVSLEDGEHELVRAQRYGISPHRAHQLAATVA